MAFTNLALFRNCAQPIGLLKRLQAALGKDTLNGASKDMFGNLGKGSKAEMALELLFLNEPDQVEPPAYILDGLNWLEKSIEARKVDSIASPLDEVENV